MSQNIQHKRSSIPGSVPSGTQLLPGELAVNTSDAKVFINSTLNNRVVGLTDNIDGGSIKNILYFINIESIPTVDLSNIDCWFSALGDTINPLDPVTSHTPANRLPTTDDYVLIYSPELTTVTGNISVGGAKFVSIVPGSSFVSFPTFNGTINGDTNIGNWKVNESIINGNVFCHSFAELSNNTIVNGNFVGSDTCAIISGTVNGNVIWNSSRPFNNVNGNVIIDYMESEGVTQNVIGNVTINNICPIFNDFNVTGNVYINVNANLYFVNGNTFKNFNINGDVYVTSGGIGYGDINGDLYLTACGVIMLSETQSWSMMPLNSSYMDTYSSGILNVSGDCRISNNLTGCLLGNHVIKDNSTLNIGGDLIFQSTNGFYLNMADTSYNLNGTLNVAGDMSLYDSANGKMQIYANSVVFHGTTSSFESIINANSVVFHDYAYAGLSIINANVSGYGSPDLFSNTINGNVNCYDYAYLASNNIIDGNCILNDQSSIEDATVASGLILNDNSYVSGPISNYLVADCTFNDNSYIFDGVVGIDGNCTFNDSATCGSANWSPTILGNGTFNDNSIITNGYIDGEASFNDSSVMNGAIVAGVSFNDNSIMTNGYIDGEASFNDSSVMINGTIVAGVSFNDSSCFIDGSFGYSIPDPPPTCSSLLLHFDGSLSDSGKDSLIVVGVSGATTSSTQSKFGTESLFCNGGYARIDNSTSLILNNSDFTIECFVYIPVLDPGTTTTHTVFSHRTSDDSNSGIFFFIDTSGNLRCFVANSSGNNWAVVNHSFGCSVSENQWHHLALVRDNSTITLYMDGIACSNSITIGSDIIGASGSFNIGCGSDKANYSPLYGIQDFIGYIDEFRFHKTSIYTSNFAPTTIPFKPPF